MDLLYGPYLSRYYLVFTDTKKNFFFTLRKKKDKKKMSIGRSAQPGSSDDVFKVIEKKSPQWHEFIMDSMEKHGIKSKVESDYKSAAAILIPSDTVFLDPVIEKSLFTLRSTSSARKAVLTLLQSLILFDVTTAGVWFTGIQGHTVTFKDSTVTGISESKQVEAKIVKKVELRDVSLFAIDTVLFLDESMDVFSKSMTKVKSEHLCNECNMNLAPYKLVASPKMTKNIYVCSKTCMEKYMEKYTNLNN